MLEFNENAVTFLVETSALTAQFLNSIRDNLIEFLHKKALETTNVNFQFNVGHFSRETCLWDDQPHHCSMAAASGAADWIRNWPVSDFHITPRGHSQHSGAHFVPALVAAFSNSSVQSVCLIAGSAPFEASNDIVTHVRFASKGRPVHVIFVTGQRNVNFNAMEILHIVSKETGGTFRVAYFDPLGQLLQVLKGGDREYLRTSLFQLDSPEKLSLIPAVNAADVGKRDQMIESNYYLASTGNLLQKKGTQGSFDDIKITMPGSTLPKTLGNVAFSPSSYTVRHMLPTAELTDRTDNDALIRFKKKLEREDQSVNDRQMSEIRKMFSKLYLDKKKKEHKRKSYKSVKAKVYKFSHPNRNRRSNSSSSYSTDNTSDSEAGDVLFDIDDLKLSRRDRGRSVSGETETYGSVSAATNRRPWSNRSARSSSSVSTSRMKPQWKQPGVVSSGFRSQRAPVSDRSQAWMNPWQNAVMKKQNLTLPGKQTKAVQIGDSGLDKGVYRPQISNNKLQRVVSQFAATDSSPPKSDIQIDTIRELVKTNNNLVKVLERQDATTEEQKRTERNRNNVLSKIRAAQSQSRARAPTASEIAAKKREVLGELTELATTNRSIGNINQQRRIDGIQAQKQHYEDLRQNRQQQIQHAIDRKQDILQQRQQQCYKAMYEKLVGDLTSRNGIPDQRNVGKGWDLAANSGPSNQNTEKPIAIVPQ